MTTGDVAPAAAVDKPTPSSDDGDESVTPVQRKCDERPKAGASGAAVLSTMPNDGRTGTWPWRPCPGVRRRRRNCRRRVTEAQRTSSSDEVALRSRDGDS